MTPDWVSLVVSSNTGIFFGKKDLGKIQLILLVKRLFDNNSSVILQICEIWSNHLSNRVKDVAQIWHI